MGTSHASGACFARAHTRITCHICTQLPSYQYVGALFATHHHAKRPASGGRKARQPRPTCPCRKILAMPNVVLYHAEGRPKLQHPPSPCQLRLPAKHVALATQTRPQTTTSILCKPLHRGAAYIARVARAHPYLQSSLTGGWKRWGKHGWGLVTIVADMVLTTECRAIVW